MHLYACAFETLFGTALIKLFKTRHEAYIRELLDTANTQVEYMSLIAMSSYTTVAVVSQGLQMLVNAIAAEQGSAKIPSSTKMFLESAKDFTANGFLTMLLARVVLQWMAYLNAKQEVVLVKNTTKEAYGKLVTVWRVEGSVAVPYLQDEVTRVLYPVDFFSAQPIPLCRQEQPQVPPAFDSTVKEQYMPNSAVKELLKAPGLVLVGYETEEGWLTVGCGILTAEFFFAPCHVMFPKDGRKPLQMKSPVCNAAVTLPLDFKFYWQCDVAVARVSGNTIGAALQVRLAVIVKPTSTARTLYAVDAAGRLVGTTGLCGPTNPTSMFIFHNCSTVPGNSGAPMLDASTRASNTIVGMHLGSSTLKTGETYNYCVNLYVFVEEWKTTLEDAIKRLSSDETVAESSTSSSDSGYYRADFAQVMSETYHRNHRDKISDEDYGIFKAQLNERFHNFRADYYFNYGCFPTSDMFVKFDHQDHATAYLGSANFESAPPAQDFSRAVPAPPQQKSCDPASLPSQEKTLESLSSQAQMNPLISSTEKLQETEEHNPSLPATTPLSHTQTTQPANQSSSTGSSPASKRSLTRLPDIMSRVSERMLERYSVFQPKSLPTLSSKLEFAELPSREKLSPVPEQEKSCPAPQPQTTVSSASSKKKSKKKSSKKE